MAELGEVKHADLVAARCLGPVTFGRVLQALISHKNMHSLTPRMPGAEAMHRLVTESARAHSY